MNRRYPVLVDSQYFENFKQINYENNFTMLANKMANIPRR